jgi:tetratricopeptide (TPR) repeat protein
LNPILIVLLAALYGAAPAYGLWVGSSPQSVPVERLISNLQARFAKEPTNEVMVASLARAYSMAYGTKVESLKPSRFLPNEFYLAASHEIVPGQLAFTARSLAAFEKTAGPQFGFTRRPAPSMILSNEVELTSREERLTRRKYLTNAIHFYQIASKLNPSNAFTQLGLGWCLQEKGETSVALNHYRIALDLASLDRENHTLYGAWNDFAAEVSWYILPLLNPVKDKDEIRKLSTFLRKPNPDLSRRYTPLVVPLKDGMNYRDCIQAGAQCSFDLDGSGPAKWSWITPGAGWIVFDLAGKGQITSGLQLFGNVTFWLFWKNGYDALAALDDDQNGWISGNELKHIGIWQDENSNGQSEPGEVQPVAAWGIAALNTLFVRNEEGIIWSELGVQFIDGKVRPTYDIILERSPD